MGSGTQVRGFSGVLRVPWFHGSGFMGFNLITKSLVAMHPAPQTTTTHNPASAGCCRRAGRAATSLGQVWRVKPGGRALRSCPGRDLQISVVSPVMKIKTMQHPAPQTTHNPALAAAARSSPAGPGRGGPADV